MRWPGKAVNHRILAAVAVSTALHAAVLTWMAYRGLEISQARPASSSGKGVVLGRLIIEATPGLPPAAAPVTQVDPRPPAPSASPGTQAPSPTVPSPAQAAATSPSVLPPAAAVAAARPASAAVPADAALARFKPASELTAKPVALSTGELEPDWLREIREPAAVKISVYVDADGTVRHVEVRSSSSPRVAEVVKKAFEEARFRPGTLQGERVAARVDISITYDAERDRIVDPRADRSAENTLSREQVRRAPSVGADLPAAGVAPK